jgi:hypothetical protein
MLYFNSTHEHLTQFAAMPLFVNLSDNDLSEDSTKV